MVSKRLKSSSLIPLIVLGLLCLPALRPLFHPGFFSMHDDQQVIRLAELDHALTSGQFPVRWVSRLGFGYGYPLFIFYPPLVYYLGEFFHLLGASFILSTKFVFALAFLGAAYSMYRWAKYRFGTIPAVVAALFYTYAPYHAVDAYVRGALAETFSFVWLPTILLTLDHLSHQLTSTPRTSRFHRRLLKSGLILSLLYSLLMITHNLIVLPFSFIIGLYLLATAIRLPSRRLFFLLFTSIFFFLGLGLSAFFWIPALAEKQHTLVDSVLLTQGYSYSLHYIKPYQLWNSIWGYGGSAPLNEIDGFSLKIGKLHLVLASLVGFVSLTLLISPRMKKLKPTFLFLVASFLILFFSAFMTTRYSSFIWDHFPPFHYIQFPWRFLTFTNLFSSLLAGASVWLLSQFINHIKTLPQKISPFFILSFSFLIISLLFLPNLKLFSPSTYLNVSDDYYLSDDFAKWTISKTSFEFLPEGVTTHLEPPLNITQVDITKDQIALSTIQPPPDFVTHQTLLDLPHLKVLGLHTPTAFSLVVNTYNFPGWQAHLNDQPLPITDDNSLQLITLEIPPGTHQLTLNFTNTPPRRFANYLSLTTLALTLLLLIPQTKLTKLFSRK